MTRVDRAGSSRRRRPGRCGRRDRRRARAARARRRRSTPRRSRSPISRQARMMRTAISPRLAISSAPDHSARSSPACASRGTRACPSWPSADTRCAAIALGRQADARPSGCVASDVADQRLGGGDRVRARRQQLVDAPRRPRRRARPPARPRARGRSPARARREKRAPVRNSSRAAERPILRERRTARSPPAGCRASPR